MGAWGAGIFDDDVAADVRDAWKDAVTAGIAPADAARSVVDGFSELVEDPDDGPIMFITLAALQIEANALDDGIRDVALASIPANRDRWSEEASPEDAAERARVLDELEQKLRAG